MYEFMHHLRRGVGPGSSLELFESGFFPVSEAEIVEAEKTLGFRLPEELRTLYQEVGERRLQTGTNGDRADFNYLVSPLELPKLLSGQSDWLMPYSEIEPSTLPFFVRDTDLFLCLHSHSSRPAAVFWMWGGEICGSVVEFFKRLVDVPNWFIHARV